MKRLFISFFAMVLLVAAGALKASAQNPVSWKTSVEWSSDTEGTVVLSGAIEDGWHIYGPKMPADGPNATQIFFKCAGVSFVGNCKVAPATIKTYDPMYGCELSYWEHKVVFKRKFKVTSPKDASITITAKYMGCNDSNCIPPRTETFNVKLAK